MSGQADHVPVVAVKMTCFAVNSCEGRWTPYGAYVDGVKGFS